MRAILAGESKATAWIAGAILAGWLALVLPLVVGQRTLLLRDVFVTHLPYKAFGAEALRHGEVPAVFPGWALGQPFRGNPNALPFYPGNLLYLVLPFWSALNLHYVLHWALAAVGAGFLARRYGASGAAACLAAITYAGSGYMLSALTFYNLLTVAAWAPWVLTGLAVGGRRGVAAAGLACGLMLLGGEPLTAAIVVPLMALVAVERHGWRRGLGGAAVAGALGLVLAAPQIVASLQVLGESWRSVHGIDPRQAVANDLHPFRLLELVLPLPWGWPSDWNRFAYWAPRVTPHLPYIFSLHFGVVAFGLALAGVRERRSWALAAVAGLAAAWALGLSPTVTHALTFGYFRYPQKILLVPALAGALLAARGFDRVVAGDARARRWGLAAGGTGLLLLAALVGFPDLARLFRERLVAGGDATVAATQAGHWIVLLAAAALLLAGTAWAVARRSAAGVLALQALALLQLAPAWVTDRTESYRDPSDWVAYVAATREATGADGVLAVPAAFPYWEERQPYSLEAQSPVAQARIARLDLEPSFATLYGLSAPLAPDLEGLTAARMAALEKRLAAATWEERMPWLRRLGVAWVTRNRAGELPEATAVESVDRMGAPTTLFQVPGALPRLRWPERLALAPDPEVAFTAVASGRLTDLESLVERLVDQRPGARLELRVDRPDEIVFEVEGEGGLAVVARSYWPFYRARLEDGTLLATQAADLVLLGVEVPPGRHVVRVAVEERGRVVAAWISALTGAALLWLALGGRGLRS